MPLAKLDECFDSAGVGLKKGIDGTGLMTVTPESAKKGIDAGLGGILSILRHDKKPSARPAKPAQGADEDGVAVFRGPTTMIGVDTIHEALFGKKVVKKHQDGLITAQTAADATIFMAPGFMGCVAVADAIVREGRPLEVTLQDAFKNKNAATASPTRASPTKTAGSRGARTRGV